MITGLLLSVLLVPDLTIPGMKRFYAWPYLKSAVMGTLYCGKVHLDVYQILYAGKLPVVGGNAEEASGELHTEEVRMHAPARVSRMAPAMDLHGRLRTSVRAVGMVERVDVRLLAGSGPLSRFSAATARPVRHVSAWDTASFAARVQS